ncbi:Uncharacterised protein r2_g2715 [Pycnogonum litorale]
MGPDRVRTYKDEFLSLGFTSIVDKGVEKPQCVVCAKVLSAASMKRNHLQRHFKTEHSQLRDKDQAFFKRKLELLSNCQNKKAAYYRRRTDNACIKDVVRLVIGQDQAKKLSAVSVSDNTIQRRIVDISEHIEARIVNGIKQSPYYVIASDESTDVASLSQLIHRRR